MVKAYPLPCCGVGVCAVGVKREAGSGALGFCSQNLFSGSDGDSLSQTSGGLAQGMTVAGLIPSLQDALTCTDWAGNERISLTHLPGACCQSPGWTKSIAASLLLRLQKLRGPPRGGVGRQPFLLSTAQLLSTLCCSHAAFITGQFPTPQPSQCPSHPAPCTLIPVPAAPSQGLPVGSGAEVCRALLGREMQWDAGKCSGVHGNAVGCWAEHTDMVPALGTDFSSCGVTSLPLQGGSRVHHGAWNPFPTTSPQPKPPS